VTKLLATAAVVGALGVGAGCGPLQQRFPDEVQAALAGSELRRLETARFIIYYPAQRRAEIDRFVIRAERCAEAVRAAALVHNGVWRDKMVIAMPEVAFNNAFVLAAAQGYDQISVIPTMSTIDLSSEYGLLPDPGAIACHELVHYVQFQQLAGVWRVVDAVFGALYTPQLGYDPWLLEGLATHYEAKLVPGSGRPTWPIFTGMFAAGYAGERVTGGDMSEYGRKSSAGHHYLVGSMFVRFLTERYGEPPLWVAIAAEARALTGWLFTGTFKQGFGVSFGDLLGEFDAWHAATFPVRQRPAAQRALATLGNDARYARGRDGTEAWVADDVDRPSRLIVRDPDGATLAEISLVDVVPPRTLIEAEPILASGLSITADGREVWLTIIDRATTYQVPRLLRWRRGESTLTEVNDALGPGATIDPAGATYYYCAVDGDRWSLAAWDVAHDRRRTLVDMAPGTYVLGAQVSADGARLIANVWNGAAFVAWVIDAATGARLGELGGAGTPVWDASFTDDGRAMYLGVIDGRFQVMIDGQPVTDAPYAVLAARAGRGTIRFMNRERWSWTLDEVALSVPDVPGEGAAPLADPVAASPGPALTPPLAIAGSASDEPYSAWEHFWFPQLRSPIVLAFSDHGPPHIGAILGGGDRLGMQRWSIAGYVEPPGGLSSALHGGAAAEYLNTMLAPWQIDATAGFVDWVDSVGTADPAVSITSERRTRDASLSVARTWRDTLTTTVGGNFAEDTEQLAGELAVRRRLAGPVASFDWASIESTRYTGARRALYVAGSAGYYPHALSSFAGDIYDTRGLVATRLPLPLGRRHTVLAELRGRALISRDATGLLQLGGDAVFEQLFSGSSVATPPPDFDDRRFPASYRFIEPLRGYEDYAVTTDRAVIGDLAWDYPLIVDRGYAATFGFLPASFVRELDFELFAAGAIDRAGAQHAAVGARLTLSFVLLRFPLLLDYQLARRVRDDDAVTQRVGIGFPL
jgi:hypothetical protein